MRNNVQAAITADRIRVSLERRLLIEPAKAHIWSTKRGESENQLKIRKIKTTTYQAGYESWGTCHQEPSLFLEHQ